METLTLIFLSNLTLKRPSYGGLEVKMSEKNQKFQGCLPTKYSRCSGRFDFTSDRRCEHADDCARFQALRFLDRECGIENYTDIEVYMAADNCEYKIGPELFNVINGGMNDDRS